ncbi:MAG: S41 family peptidase [Candidatus Hydrothermia bacterium]
MKCLLLYLTISLLNGRPVKWALAPALSPDGEYIAFSYHGDIWIAPSQGGLAIRVTSSPAFETNPIFSPDGKWLAYTSDESGNNEIYVVRTDGSFPPKRVTYHPDSEYPLYFTEDSKYIVFTASMYDFRGGVYKISIQGGNPQKLFDFVVNEIYPIDSIHYIIERGNEPWYRKGYRGPAASELYLYDKLKNIFVRLTENNFRDARPMYSKYKGGLFFLSNRGEGGTTNLYLMDLESRNVTQLTKFSEEINWARISDDGRKIVMEVMGEIYIYDVTLEQLSKPDIKVMDDFDPEAEISLPISSNITDFALSPSGDELAFIALGDVFVMCIDTGSLDYGKIVQVTRTPEPERDVSWSTEGEYLFYASLKSGNYDVYRVRPANRKKFYEDFSFVEESIVSSKNTEKRPLLSPDGTKVAFIKDRGKLYVKDLKTGEIYRIGEHSDVLWVSWSPDSRYIAYSRTELGPREDVYVVGATKGSETINISNHPNDDYKPMWTNDGERLFYASRNYEGDWWIKYVFLKDSTSRNKDEYLKKVKDSDTLKDSVRIDFENLRGRTVSVYRFRAYYNYYTISPNGLLIAVQAEDLNGNDVWIVDHEGKNPRRITTTNLTPLKMEFTRDGKKLYFLSKDGKIFECNVEKGNFREVAIKGNVYFKTGKLYESLMLEGWWMLKDGFYDENMHGVNWENILGKYKSFINEIKTYREFNNVVYRMLGELNASHLGIWQERNEEGEKFYDLGVILDASYSREGVKVHRVISGSPAEKAGIRAGDVILKINDVPVSPDFEFQYYLRNLSDDVVQVSLSRKEGKTKTIVVKAKCQSYWSIRDLLYKEWVEGNRRIVDSLSNGEFAYIHIRGMGDWNYAEFEKDIYENRHKKGLILDIRYNGGGHIHDELLNFLRRTSYLVEKERDGVYEYNSLFRWDKPTVLVINQYCFSDAEIFPAGFKRLKLGKVVGVPTFGGVIGTTNYTLFDGKTVFREPHEGWYFDPQGRSLENTPIEPDIYVEDQIFEDNYSGSTQLRRAVEVLKEMVGD